jgi:hypothetical protein
MLLRMERTVTSPRRPPNAPGEAASRPQTFPVKHSSDFSFGTGRETQSMTFLSAAVIELLYSGQPIRSPTWALNSSFS